MEKNTEIRLIDNYKERLLEVLEVTGKIDDCDIEYCYELSINCLEAKPKALNSMQEFGNAVCAHPYNKRYLFDGKEYCEKCKCRIIY